MHTPATKVTTASTNPDPTWYTDARFGLFIHWGLYALPAGTWEGREVDYIGEWLQHGERIPCARYAAFARDFHPTRFDALAWVRAAKDAGMRYVVFTAKHHDGFALYHSAVDPFNVVGATPWGRDPLAELAVACRAEGMRLGIYYSHCVDWREAHAGSADLKEAGRMWGNDWEFPPGTADGFDEYLVRKAEPQLTELLSNYGDIALLWFDTPIATLTRAQAQRIHDLVRRLQPECLIGNRLGHGLGDIDGLGDNQAPRTPTRRPGEACVTLNETWGYKAHDHDWKNPAQVAGLLAACAAKDCNLLLNIGPQADGAFPAAALEILAGIGTWLKQHGAAIHGTRGSPLPVDPPGCAVTQDETHVHVFALDPDITEVVLNGCLPPLPPLIFDQTADAFPRHQSLPLSEPLRHDGQLHEQAEVIILPAHYACRPDGSRWEGWCSADERAAWNCVVDRPGRFAVFVGCGGATYGGFQSGHQVVVQVGSQSCRGVLTNDAPLTALHTRHYPESRTRIGEVQLDTGIQHISLHVEIIGPAGFAMIPELRFVRLDTEDRTVARPQK